MKTNELKIWPKYFEAVVSGKKTFEYRKDDRGFSFGDVVTLREWDPTRDYEDSTLRKLKEPRGYTGAFAVFKIGYVLPVGNGDYVVFSLLPE